VGCRFEHQVMGELPNVNTYSPVDFLVSPSLAQLDLVKPLRSFCSLLQYIMPKSKVPLKYFKICLTAYKLGFYGLAMNLLTTLIT